MFFFFFWPWVPTSKSTSMMLATHQCFLVATTVQAQGMQHECACHKNESKNRYFWCRMSSRQNEGSTHLKLLHKLSSSTMVEESSSKQIKKTRWIAAHTGKGHETIESA